VPGRVITASTSTPERGVDGPPVDPARIVRTFAAHDVEYLLVGGVAAQAHGAKRKTLDFDCLTRHQPENLSRLCDALAELNARLRIEGMSDADAKALSRGVIHPEFFQRAEITTWMTDAGPLDVLRDIPAGDGTRRSYEQLVGRGADYQLAGLRVKVASLDDIIASKEWANRPKDHATLPELRRLTARRTPSPPDPEPPEPDAGP
jgi:hypothetical protein